MKSSVARWVTAGVGCVGVIWLCFAYLRNAETNRRTDANAPFSADPSAPESGVERTAPIDTSFVDRKAAGGSTAICRVTGPGGPVRAELIVLEWTEKVAREADSVARFSAATLADHLWRHHVDETGLLELELPPPPFVVGARSSGLAPIAKLFTTSVSEVVLDLVPGTYVEGTIRDELHSMLSNVTVRIDFDKYNDSFDGDPLPAPLRGVASIFRYEYMTGTDGRFYFDGVLTDEWHNITATAPGFVDSTISRTKLPRQRPIEIVLLRGVASIRGRVLDVESMSAIHPARIVCTQFEKGRIVEIPGIFESDAEGGFSIRSVAARASETYVDVMADGYGQSRSRLAKLAEGTVADIVVLLGRVKEFVGRVIPVGGMSLIDLEAWAMDWRQEFPYDIVRVAEDGSFTLTRVPADTPFVIVITRNRDTLDKAVVLTPWQQPFEIVLNPRRGLRGRTLADNYPLPGESRVRLASEGNQPGLVSERFVEPNFSTGEFVFPDLDAGTYFLDAFVPGYAVERIAHIVHDPTDESQKPIEVTLRRGAELVGAVRDSSTGKPIEGALVELADISPMGWDTLYGHYPESCSVSSDSEGKYRHANVDPEEPITLIVSAPGFGRRQIRHNANPHERSVRLDISLDQASRVTVRAIRPDGTPARCFLFAARCTDRLTRSVSTENGVAEIDDLIAGSVKGNVILQDVDLGEAQGATIWQDFEIGLGSTSDLVFDFSRGATIRGQVRSTYYDHIPNSQTVTVRRVEEDGIGERASNVSLPNQRYAVFGVPAGKVRVELSTIAPGPDTASERILEVEDGKTYEVDFVVSGAALRGFVRASSGAPVAGARVRMRRTSEPSLDGIVDATVDGWHLDTSKTDGSVELIGLLDGLQEFEVSAEGFGRLEGSVDFAESRSSDEWIVRLDPEAVLGVTVKDRAGNPVEGARVKIRLATSRSPTTRPPTAIDDDRFEFRGIGTGDYVVAAEAAGWFAAELHVAIVAGTKREATITMRRPSALWLKLLGPNGELLARSPLRVVDLETGTSVATWAAEGRVRVEPADLATNEKAEICFDGLPEGRYRVTAAGIEEDLEVGAAVGEKPKTLQSIR